MLCQCKDNGSEYVGLADIVLSTKQLGIAMSYAEEILKLSDLPQYMRKEISDNLIRCKTIYSQHSSLIDGNNYQLLLFSKMREFTAHMYESQQNFISSFIKLLDRCLLMYSDGPPISTKAIYHDFPLT